MANKLYNDIKIQAIADAIRAKNSSTATYKVGEMAEAITAIPTGEEDKIIALLSNGAVKGSAIYDFSTLPITSLRAYAFHSFQNQQILNQIILPNGIPAINEYTFYSCKYTTNIVLPDSIIKIGNMAFAYCTNLALTELPANITSIGTYAFNECTNLALIELPANITSIGTYAFNECTNLALIELPANITSIGAYAFNECTNLALTELPANITSIGTYAFNECTNLALIELPANITSIGTYAFSKCTKLTKIAINSPNLSLKSQYILDGCSNIKTLKIKAESIAVNYAFGTLSLEKVWISQNCRTILGKSLTSHAFWNNNSFDIYCEASSTPTGWGSYWYYYASSYSSAATIHWGVTEEEFDALDETTEETITE